jgi:uncharacterized membrane protein YphA (DoxX/SURF4 family)
MSIAIGVQILIALGIFNVWLLRRDRATPYRPDGAGGIQDEFRRYGFPDWTWKVVGAAKVTLAVLLLAGIFVPVVVPFAAGAMALLMVAAIAAHLKVRDPMMKSMPALLMLAMSAYVVVAYTV